MTIPFCLKACIKDSDCLKCKLFLNTLNDGHVKIKQLSFKKVWFTIIFDHLNSITFTKKGEQGIPAWRKSNTGGVIGLNQLNDRV
jgi:hypothetical protein